VLHTIFIQQNLQPWTLAFSLNVFDRPSDNYTYICIYIYIYIYICVDNKISAELSCYLYRLQWTHPWETCLWCWTLTTSLLSRMIRDTVSFILLPHPGTASNMLFKFAGWQHLWHSLMSFIFVTLSYDVATDGIFVCPSQACIEW